MSEINLPAAVDPVDSIGLKALGAAAALGLLLAAPFLASEYWINAIIVPFLILSLAGQVVLAKTATETHAHCLEHAVHTDGHGTPAEDSATVGSQEMTCCGAFAFLPAAPPTISLGVSSPNDLTQVALGKPGLRAPPETPPPNG